MTDPLPLINKSWTLFLDRDGVINKHLPNAYVTSLEEFELIPGSIESIVKLSKIFGRVIVVTNQQGIGKGLMTTMDLEKIHFYLEEQVAKLGGKIDSIYYCPHLAQYKPICRKPETGMAMQAQEDYPEIQFHQSVMIGDSPTDMEFGRKLGAFNVMVSSSNTIDDSIDLTVASLKQFADLFA